MMFPFGLVFGCGHKKARPELVGLHVLWMVKSGQDFVMVTTLERWFECSARSMISLINRVMGMPRRMRS